MRAGRRFHPCADEPIAVRSSIYLKRFRSTRVSSVNILLWNQDWFAAELRAQGHTVTTMGYSSHLDVALESPIIHIDTAIKRIPGGVRPDLIIVHDNSAPIGLDGLESTDIKTIFYSVDTHHHCDLHVELAKVFDVTFVAQRDYMPAFEAAGINVHWLPLWVSREVTPIEPKEFGAVFVGTLNAKLNPDRVAFFEALQKAVPLVCKSGDWATIFDRSEIVINQTVKGDLNFRVFEAMGAGALLLTEKSPNGLFDIFKEGEHLVTYTKGDVQEAAERIRELLADKDRLRRIASRGRNEVMGKHRAEHRLAEVLRVATAATKRPKNVKHVPLLVNFSALGRRLFKLNTAVALHAYALALKHAEESLQCGEMLTQTNGFYLVTASIRHDQLLQGDAGSRLLEAFAERFPDMVAFKLALIRAKLNAGRVTEAEEYARKHFPLEPRDVFKGAEDLIRQLLEEV